MGLDTWGVTVVGARRSLGPFLCVVNDQGMVLMEECFMLLENEMFLLCGDQSGRQSGRFFFLCCCANACAG